MLRLRLNATLSILTVNSRRLLALTLTLVFVLPLSVLAANWQWNRHIERESRNALVVENRTKNTPFEEVVRLNSTEIAHLQYSQTRFTGEVIAGSQVYWRRQILNGQPGFIELVNVQNKLGVFTVATGWLAAAGNEPDPNLTLAFKQNLVNAEVRIRLMPLAEADPADLPPGQTNSVGTRSEQNFYLELISAPHDLSNLPAPEIESGPHLGYVGQWILIGITAIVTYVMLLRRGYASETKSA